MDATRRSSRGRVKPHRCVNNDARPSQARLQGGRELIKGCGCRGWPGAYDNIPLVGDTWEKWGESGSQTAPNQVADHCVPNAS